MPPIHNVVWLLLVVVGSPGCPSTLSNFVLIISRYQLAREWRTPYEALAEPLRGTWWLAFVPSGTYPSSHRVSILNHDSLSCSCTLNPHLGHSTSSYTWTQSCVRIQRLLWTSRLIQTGAFLGIVSGTWAPCHWRLVRSFMSLPGTPKLFPCREPKPQAPGQVMMKWSHRWKSNFTQV